MISTMIFEDSQVMIGDEVETLVHHGVPIFVVGFVHLHCSIKLSLFEVKDEDEAKQEEELVHCSSFPRKIFDIFVHLSSNRIGHVSPWIIDHPCNLRENGNRSEVPVWWLGRELDLFSAHCYSGIPGGALYAVGKVFRWGCIEAAPLLDHNPQLMECVNALMENMYCSPDALPDPEDLEVTQHNTEDDEDYDERWQWEIAWTKEEQESYLGRKLLAGAILGSPTSLAEVQRLVRMKGKTKKGYHSSQRVQPEVVYLQNHWCKPDAWVREKHPEIREHKKRKSEEDAEWALGFMCSLLESERPVDLPPGMMEKILISLSGEPLVQADSEDIPAEESMVTDTVMTAELEGITPAPGDDGGKNLMNPQPMEVEGSPVAGKDIILIPDVVLIPDAEELRRMMEDDYMPSGVVKPMSKEGMIGNTSLEESGLSEQMDVDIVLYQAHPSNLVHPSSPAPQVPRCTGSSIQPGSKHRRDDLSSSPKQSKELTLHQRLGPPVDVRASWPSRGGSLISWMTEQPPHMSRSSARPGPPLLPLSPPQSHIPTRPRSPHPYLPSCRRSPSSRGYRRHSPSPSSQ